MLAVYLNDWDSIEFMMPEPSLRAYTAFCDIYRRFLIPAAPYVFGRMILYQTGRVRKDEGKMNSSEEHLHQETDETESFSDDFYKTINSLYNRTCKMRYGCVSDLMCKLTILFKENVRISKKGVRFKNQEVKNLYMQLKKKGRLVVESGTNPETHIIPIGLKTGYLSQVEKDAYLKVNSSFFIMDRFDLASVYDCVGTPIGLMVKNGEIFNPPLYKREALLVRKDGRIEIAVVSLEALCIRIQEKIYQHANNCLIYTRPSYKETPAPTHISATDLVIIGRSIIAVHQVQPKTVKTKNKKENHTQIPASGFVLRIMNDQNENKVAKFEPGMSVTYAGLENVRFGLQVGNSILKNTIKTKKFISPFYNIHNPFQTAFPPSLYPLDFENARAARIALGVDAEKKPVILWAEGAGKVAYKKGVDSTGATLLELGDYCLDAGMVSAINLDGGGSAQILLHNRRKLKISDRRAEDNQELERAVPCGLIVR